MHKIPEIEDKLDLWFLELNTLQPIVKISSLVLASEFLLILGKRIREENLERELNKMS